MDFAADFYLVLLPVICNSEKTMSNKYIIAQTDDQIQGDEASLSHKSG